MSISSLESNQNSQTMMKKIFHLLCPKLEQESNVNKQEKLSRNSNLMESFLNVLQSLNQLSNNPMNRLFLQHLNRNNIQHQEIGKISYLRTIQMKLLWKMLTKTFVKEIFQ